MNEKKETIKDILDGLLSKDSVESLAAIDSAETIRILLGHVASRIAAAVKREREASEAIVRAYEATAGELAKERDRAVQYANAAPHPGSASWKEMQSAARKVATLRDSLVEILDRTNLEKERDYDAALNGGILEIHDIANTALNETKGE